GQSGGGPLGAGAPGGRLGAGQGPRAALPGRDGSGRPGGRGPQGPSAGNQTPSLFDQGAPSAPPQGRPAPAGAGFGQQQGPAAPQAAPPSGNQGQVPPQRGNAPERGRRPQLPPRGGARPELPGGDQQQRTPSWSDDNARPPAPRPSMDAPRGHDEPDVSRTAAMPRFDDRQGPGATAEIPRFDEQQQAPGQDTGQYGRPGANGAPATGQFVRGDIFGAPQGGRPGAQDPAATGQFPAAQGYDNGTGQYPAPGQDNGSTGQYPLPGRPGSDPSNTGQFERPRMHGAGPVPPRPQPPQEQRQPSDQWALPPASGPGDGRTPLYDTLETNWFRGGQGGAQEQGNGSAPAAPPQPQQSPQPQSPTGSQRSNAAWRSSPNDELVKQAERVRKPAAGGVTTSGLPRRVPKANLVPGTAQQQNHQSGPQVSRAPDDVRGRLTNLRRGIAQGRQAGSGQTGSFPHPTHQQER
ncbi:hypothetical protein ABZ465_32975, partial [Streptomyces griseoincarnatus]